MVPRKVPQLPHVFRLACLNRDENPALTGLQCCVCTSLPAQDSPSPLSHRMFHVWTHLTVQSGLFSVPVCPAKWTLAQKAWSHVGTNLGGEEVSQAMPQTSSCLITYGERVVFLRASTRGWHVPGGSFLTWPHTASGTLSSARPAQPNSQCWSSGHARPGTWNRLPRAPDCRDPASGTSSRASGAQM